MKEAKHILILPMYYPERDSSPHRGYMFSEQATQIAANGFKVGLAFVEQRPLNRFTPSRFINESHFQTSTEENSSFNTLRMHAWNPKLSTARGGKIWARLTEQLVKQYIRRYGRPDLIHAHFSLWAGYAAHRIYRKMGIPYVLTEHASSINDGKLSETQKEIVRMACADAKQVICVGSMLQRNLQQIIAQPEKTIVVPNFVDIDTFAPGNRITDKEKEFRFVSVGNLTRRKGMHELIEAFAREFAQMPHIKLYIVGDGEELSTLQQQIDAAQLQQQINLKGRMNRDALAQLLAVCDAFVLPSHAETFGIVYIEALATGMPAIGTICGGPEDIITPDCGYLINPGDIDALASSMKELYHNYELFDKERIRQSIADRYDFRLAGQQLKTIYLNALQS